VGCRKKNGEIGSMSLRGKREGGTVLVILRLFVKKLRGIRTDIMVQKGILQVCRSASGFTELRFAQGTEIPFLCRPWSFCGVSGAGDMKRGRSFFREDFICQILIRSK
jgi:hypothetical protein